MEQKINNQKIFRYVPSLIARLLLDSNLQDKDIFSDGRNEETKNLYLSKKIPKASKVRNNFLTTSLINANIYPISHLLRNTLVMNIRLKGFQKLISTLSIKDPKDQKEKLVSEYLSMTTAKILLKISKIISDNGGEIIKYNDYEFITIWNFIPKKKRLRRYLRFYSKQAILSAYQIMNEVDNTEITNGIKVKISIGIAIGKTSIVFFGGERKRGEYIVMGETIQKAEICLNYCLNHEVIISKEINDLFKKSDEIYTREIDNDENINLFLITNFKGELLKDFRGFKIRMKYDKLKLTKTVYENLANKVYIFSSILPQGLVKYLDVGQDENLKEINVVTIATIHILLNHKIMDNLPQIQNIILDIQKSTYLTFGSLLYISKTYNGLLVRCVWGMDPGSFLDDTARSITTARLIGSLTENYDIKIGIGIATGSCYIGLIPLQGDRKQFTILGKRINLSRTLADEAFQKVIDKNSKAKYCIFCDKKTMKQSQKWYRHIYISQMNIYFDKDSQELYYETKEEYCYTKYHRCRNSQDNTNNYKNGESMIDFDENKKKENKSNSSQILNFDKMTRNNTSLFGEYNRHKTVYFKNRSKMKDKLNEKTNLIVQEIYAPIEIEEYFIPRSYDIFPLIRTHLKNSYSPRIKKYFYNHFKYISFGNKIYLDGIANYSFPGPSSEEEQNKIEKKFIKSNKVIGRENEIKRFINIMEGVTNKNKKQIILIKGPLGVGKSLFLRKALNDYLDKNEELKNIHLNEDEFIFCNKLDPLVATFPYNTMCFLFRKLFFHLKRLNLLEELCEKTREINLDNEHIKNINFILSMGKKDINVKEEFDKALKENNLIKSLKTKYEFKSNSNPIQFKSLFSSVISNLEGPYKIKDSNKINNFFFEMIKIYKMYLNNKYNKNKLSKSSKTKNKVPLIFVIDDVQLSDKNAIDFIRYLFNNDYRSNNPFIIILVEQIPFNKNFSPFSHRELEFFLSAFSEYDEKIGKDKIMCFDLQPFHEKNIIQDIIIQKFNNYIIKNYDTEIKKIDEKIIDFLLMKSFQGNPLLVISLFETLLKSQKYVKIIECTSECIITKELLDDNEVFDWSNLLIPYIYEKISSMMINNLLNFKETLLLKYACTIGTIFDIQTLDKINPLNILIKREDLFQIMQKLCDEYIIEIFDDENIIRKSKKYLICKISFPFMREVLIQKFPIERRAELHAKTAKLLTGGKKMYFFSSKIEGKILRRHLIYSEIDVVKEVESKIGKNIPETYKNTKIMNSENLKVLFVKDLCSRIFDRKYKNVLEGDLEAKVGEKWEKVSYFIDRTWKIHFKIKITLENSVEEFELKAPIKDIYKNTILEDGKTLELILIEYSFYIQNEQKEKAYVRSDDPLDIFHLDTAITFLKVVANCEKYINNFGYTHFPIYKPGTYDAKEKKYCANFVKNQLSYFDNLNPNKRKRLLSCFGLENRTERIIHESKDVKKPFLALMHTAFTIVLAKIQMNIAKNINESEVDEDEEIFKLIHGKNVYLIYLQTAPHVKVPINKYLDDFAQKEKEEEELLKMRKKNKYSFLPTSLLKEERRILGGSINIKRRNQSICEMKPLISHFEDNKDYKDKKEKKEYKGKRPKINKEFAERRKEKFRTIKEKKEEIKEVIDSYKCNTSIELIDYSESESENKSKSKSKSKNKRRRRSKSQSESPNHTQTGKGSDTSSSKSNSSDMSDIQSVTISESSEKSEKSENNEKNEKSESFEKDKDTKENNNNKSHDSAFNILKKYTFQNVIRNNSSNSVLRKSSFKFKNLGNDNHIKKKCSFKIDNLNSFFKKEHIFKIEDDESENNESKNDSFNESKDDNDEESKHDDFNLSKNDNDNESKHNIFNESSHENINDNESKHNTFNESSHDSESESENDSDSDSDSDDDDNNINKKNNFKNQVSDSNNNNYNNNSPKKKYSSKSINSNSSNDNFILKKNSLKRNNTHNINNFIKFNIDNNNLDHSSNSKENNIKINDKKSDNIRKVKSNKNKSKYNINNFINNKININIIENNYLNQTLKNTFIKNNLLNEYYKNKKNNDKSNLRIPYQKESNKTRSKSISALMKKYNSDRLRSIKDKYLNNGMKDDLSNSSNKKSFDGKDEDSSSDKDSDNNDSNDIFIITAPRKRRKKNPKASTAITPIRDEIFFKILLSILGKDNGKPIPQIKEDSTIELNNNDKNRENVIEEDSQIDNNNQNKSFKSLKSFNKEKSKKVNVPKKRSSLISSLKINYRNINHNKHVTFTKNQSGNIKKHVKEKDLILNDEISNKK